ncbi:MAG: zinc-ribbon domain-containing protein [Anaerolineales bacterium]|nr:zinc-ribbon domain-containing protein [Anaerolineales bacterium]
MSLWNSVKRNVTGAQLSADKMLRINRERSTISSLEGEIRRLKRDLGDQAFMLFKDGKLKQKDITESCDAIEALYEQIRTKEEEIEAIQAETLPPAPLTGHICPNCEKNLPAKVTFCPDCGTKAIDIEPEPAAESKSDEMINCPECNAEVPGDVVFCPNCGAKLIE